MSFKMKGPGLFWSLVAACGGALMVTGMSDLMAPWLGWHTTVRMIAIGVPLAYIAFLLALAEIKVGKVALATVAVLTSAVAFFGPFELMTVAAMECGAVWMVRGFCFHKSVLGAFLDGLVAVFGFAVAMMALASSHSLATAAWSALLVQTAVIFIPDSWAKAAAGASHAASADPFDRAFHAADQALRDLAAR